MGKIHEFADSLERGQDGELFAHHWLSRWGEVGIVDDRSEQRKGIDLFLVPKEGEPLTFEVKTDYMAGKVKRLFLETASVVRAAGVEKQGWVFTTQADRVLIIVPNMVAMVFQPHAIQSFVEAMWTRYRIAHADNDDYMSQGLLVPIRDLAPHAMYKEQIEWPTKPIESL